MKSNSQLSGFVATCLCTLLLTIGITGCSTVTPYSLDLVAERVASGRLTKETALSIMRAKAKAERDYADADGFALDEEGFSAVKTTHSTETKWRDGKTVEVKVTNTSTRNVPWGAIADIYPYRRQYQYLLGDSYKVRIEYLSTTVDHGGRTDHTRYMEFNCKTYEDLLDVVAALRVLSES